MRLVGLTLSMILLALVASSGLPLAVSPSAFTCDHHHCSFTIIPATFITGDLSSMHA